MTSRFSNDQLKAVRAQFPALVAADAAQSPASGYGTLLFRTILHL